MPRILAHVQDFRCRPLYRVFDRRNLYRIESSASDTYCVTTLTFHKKTGLFRGMYMQTAKVPFLHIDIQASHFLLLCPYAFVA